MAKGATAVRANGTAPEQDSLAEAIAYEEAIAAEAAEIRGEDFRALDAPTFLKLWPLSRRAIPAGYIKHVPKLDKGKPYASDGVRSLQVQIDRMDNVFTPLGWGWRTEWQEGDKLAHVTVWIGPEGEPLVVRRARGGVDRGSTAGNVAKGSETNAAKLAFGRIGPGHEVYLGMADFDPDTDPDAADEQGKTSTAEPERKLLNDEQADRLARAVSAAGLDEHLGARLRSFGVTKLADLDTEQATRVWEWTQGEGSSG